MCVVYGVHTCVRAHFCVDTSPGEGDGGGGVQVYTAENVKLGGLWQYMVELATRFLWNGTDGTEIPGGGCGWGETIPNATLSPPK